MLYIACFKHIKTKKERNDICPAFAAVLADVHNKL
jgi:hypothetical protein